MLSTDIFLYAFDKATQLILPLSKIAFGVLEITLLISISIVLPSLS